jgi:DNA repair protein RadC
MDEIKKNISIKDWAIDDRPREKAVAKGVESLSDAELIAILIGNGTINTSALEVAQNLLASCNRNLDELARKTIKELCTSTKGIGVAKAVSILVALELGRRKSSEKAMEVKRFITAKSIIDLLQPLLEDKNVEEFYVAYFNANSNILACEKTFSGGYKSTVVDVKVILKRALDLKAISIVVAHNHPSGNANPSAADVVLTDKIREACKFFDILLTDHIIITNNGFYSFAEEGI